MNKPYKIVIVNKQNRDWRKELLKLLKDSPNNVSEYALGYNLKRALLDNGIQGSEDNSFSFIGLLDICKSNQILIFIEEYYLDKLYQDSYYDYYSHKLNSSSAFSTRIALFDLNKISNALSNEMIDTHPIVARDPLGIQNIDLSSYSIPASYLTGSDSESPDLDLVGSLLLNLFEGDSFQKGLIGTVVINPNDQCPFGRILIDPKKLILPNQGYCRTQDMDISFLGKRFSINCFPYSGQDELHASCAEVSLWAIFEFYGNKYQEFSSVLPSKFATDVLSDLNEERQFPVRGLTLQEKSLILKRFGFSPKVYVRNNVRTRSEYENFFDSLFVYIKSGITTAISISDHTRVPYHAVIGIGYEELKDRPKGEISINKLDQCDPNNPVYFYTCRISQMVDKLIFMDDALLPYRYFGISDYDHQKGTRSRSQVEAFIAPLPGEMMIDVDEARQKFDSSLSHLVNALNSSLPDSSPISFLNKKATKIDDKLFSNLIVKNIFVASSSRFIESRISDLLEFPTDGELNVDNSILSKYITDFGQPELPSSSYYAALKYSSTVLPRYIWVMELTTLELLTKELVLAEVVIDSTAIKESATKSILFARIGTTVIGHQDDLFRFLFPSEDPLKILSDSDSPSTMGTSLNLSEATTRLIPFKAYNHSLKTV